MLHDDDLKAIDTLRERLRQSIVSSDVDEYVTCFTEDGIIMHPDTPKVRGRSCIEEYAASMFESVRVSMLDLVPVSVVGDGSLAYEVGVQECEVEPALPGFKRERQHLHVYERGEDGSWRVAAAMSGNQ